MSDIISAAAIDYAAKGMFVIPAHHPVIRGGVKVCSCGREHGAGKMGKEPAIKWKEYQDTAPTVQQVLRHFDGRFRGYNIACIHGAASGTVLLDWDGMEGYASQRELVRELGALPETPTVLSGGGGSHEIYKHPGVWVPTNKGLRQNFDVRGDGGISILPPSQHEYGVYQWECDMGVDDLPFADLPQTWIDFITQEKEKPTTNKSSNQSSINQNVVWQQADDGSIIVLDGREEFMYRKVWDAFNDLQGRLHRNPKADELYDEVLVDYMTHIDTTRAGRRQDELWSKCTALVRKMKNAPPRGLTKSFLRRT